MIIDSEPDMMVIDAAATGGEAVAGYRRHSPDITLMDLQLPDMGGVDAIRAIRRLDAGARIIVLTMYKGDEDIHRAIAAGASTYLLKDTLADDLPRIVRDVHAGRETLPPDVLARLQERAAHPTLTSREVEVMKLVAAGRRDKEIAIALSISSQTVRVHMKNIYSKLGVSDRRSFQWTRLPPCVIGCSRSRGSVGATWCRTPFGSSRYRPRRCALRPLDAIEHGPEVHGCVDDRVSTLARTERVGAGHVRALDDSDLGVMEVAGYPATPDPSARRCQRRACRRPSGTGCRRSTSRCRHVRPCIGVEHAKGVSLLVDVAPLPGL